MLPKYALVKSSFIIITSKLCCFDYFRDSQIAMPGAAFGFSCRLASCRIISGNLVNLVVFC